MDRRGKTGKGEGGGEHQVSLHRVPRDIRLRNIHIYGDTETSSFALIAFSLDIFFWVTHKNARKDEI